MTEEQHDLQGTRGRSPAVAGNSKDSVGNLVAHVAQDVATLAKDEVTLAKLELESKLQTAALSAAATAISGALGLIGFALLCATAVVAIEPILPSLWARMLLMSVCYLLLGALGSAVFVLQLKRKVTGNPAPRATREARETLAAAQSEVRHG
jgi:Putative Actinobacterial Holin-X, holin superfamily III